MARYVQHIKKRHYVIALLLALVYLTNTRWIQRPGENSLRQNNPGNTDQAINDPAPNKFAGSVSCRSCHKEIYDSHIHTAHYQDSRPAAKQFIKGSFDPNRNHFVYNKKMEVVLEDKNGKLSQTAYLNGSVFQSETFDMVIGSGRKGQTYLYWDDARLFQLPVSYYTPLDSWCNSPGYSTNFIYFNKRVTAQCIECHGTYAKTNDSTLKGIVFDKRSIIYGIDCERCHGPAANHVNFHTAHPTEKTGKFIINAKTLNRQQRLDACALCHSGLRKEIRPSFTFMVGDTLDNYSIPRYDTNKVATLDVHGNQYGLLSSSHCYQMSQMDCSSCHNVHVNEVNNPKLFSQRCMNCHSDAAHTTFTLPDVKELRLIDNCIDCHMPALPSQKIFLQVDDPAKSTADLVRTHHIGIYEKSTKDFLEKIKSRKEPSNKK
jgi:hypothetical protein